MNSKTLRSLSLGAIALSRQFGVRITVEQLEKKISQGQIKSEKELKHLFSNCCNSDLISLLDGKLYRCPFSANGTHLGAIPKNPNDTVNLLNKDLSKDELNLDLDFKMNLLR